jgi:hypothetical protein
MAKTDLVPAAIKRWYYVRDSIKHAKLALKEVNVDTVIEKPVVVPKKTTFDPEAEPNRKDTTETILEKTPMLLPNDKKEKTDSTVFDE